MALDIFEDEEFKKQPQAVRDQVIRNYAKKEIVADPEFQQLKPQERRGILQRYFKDNLPGAKDIPFEPSALEAYPELLKTPLPQAFQNIPAETVTGMIKAEQEKPLAAQLGGLAQWGMITAPKAFMGRMPIAPPRKLPPVKTTRAINLATAPRVKYPPTESTVPLPRFFPSEKPLPTAQELAMAKTPIPGLTAKEKAAILAKAQREGGGHLVGEKPALGGETVKTTLFPGHERKVELAPSDVPKTPLNPQRVGPSISAGGSLRPDIGKSQFDMILEKMTQAKGKPQYAGPREEFIATPEGKIISPEGVAPLKLGDSNLSAFEKAKLLAPPKKGLGIKVTQVPPGIEPLRPFTPEPLAPVPKKPVLPKKGKAPGWIKTGEPPGPPRPFPKIEPLSKELAEMGTLLDIKLAKEAFPEARLGTSHVALLKDTEGKEVWAMVSGKRAKKLWPERFKVGQPIAMPEPVKPPGEAVPQGESGAIRPSILLGLGAGAAGAAVLPTLRKEELILPSIKSLDMIEQGNIDLSNRPIRKNPDGTISTVQSISVNIDGKEILMPTLSDDGRKLSNQEAIDLYKRTGKHLGKFSSIEAATNYAKELSQKQRKQEPPPSLPERISSLILPGSAESAELQGINIEQIRKELEGIQAGPTKRILGKEASLEAGLEELKTALRETGLIKAAGQAVTTGTDSAKYALGKTFDIMSRTNYAVANFAKAVDEGSPKMAALWRGLSGQDKASFIDLAKKYNVPFPTLTGLAADIVLDPLTWVPIGLVTKPLLGLAGKGIAKIPGVKPVIGLFSETFAKSKEFKEYYEMKRLARIQGTLDEASLLEKLQELAKGTTNAERELLSAARQDPAVYAQLSATLKAKVDDFAQAFDTLGREAVSKELITQKQFDKWAATYLPGITKETTKGIPSGGVPPTLFEKTQKGFFAKPKTFATLAERKAYAIKNARPDLLPEENIAKLFGLRGVAQARWLRKKEFIEETMVKFGQRIEPTVANLRNIPEGMSVYMPKGVITFFPAKTPQMKSLKKVLLSAQKGDLIDLSAKEMVSLLNWKEFAGISKQVPAYLVPKEIGDDLNKIGRYFINDVATNQVLRAVDKVVGIWKALATSFRFPFHVRNVESGIYMMWLAGVNPVIIPIRLKQAARIAQKTSTGNLGQYTFAEIRDLAAKHGVVNQGWMGADTSQYFFKEMERVLESGGRVEKAVKHPWREASRAAREFGTVLENNGRLGLFVDGLIKGKSPKDAAAIVNKYHFDYTRATPFEREVMGRAEPFYKWMRANIPLTFETLVTQPGKWATVAKTQAALGRKYPETPFEARVKPEYMKEFNYIKTPWKSDKGNPIYGYMDLPFTELARVFSRAQMLSSLSPVKVIPEILFNLRTFPKIGKIEQFPGQKVPAPFYVLWLPTAIQKAIGAEPIRLRTGERVIGIDPRKKYALTTVLPFLSEMEKLYPGQPVSLEEERSPWRKISYGTGIKFMPVDPERELKIQRFQQLENIKDLRRRVRQDIGVLSQEERQEILEQRD